MITETNSFLYTPFSLPNCKIIHRDEFDQSLSINPFSYAHLTGRDNLELSFEEFAANLPSASDGTIDPEILQNRSCPLCNSHDSKVLFVKYRFPVCVCLSCDFIYATPVLRQSSIHTASMDIGELSKNHLSLVTQDFYIQCARKRFEYELQQVFLRSRRKPKSYLEIGCSIGTGLEVAAKYNLEAVGFEPNSDAAQIALKKGFQVIIDFFDPSYFKDRTFDIVTNMDVLEHVDNPIGFLKKIAHVMADDALLLQQVPNAGGLISLVEMQKNQLFNGLIHLNYFDNNTLTRATEKAGFKCIGNLSILSELGKLKQYPLELIKKILSKKRPDISNDFSLHQDWIHNHQLGYKAIGIYMKDC